VPTVFAIAVVAYSFLGRRVSAWLIAAPPMCAGGSFERALQPARRPAEHPSFLMISLNLISSGSQITQPVTLYPSPPSRSNETRKDIVCLYH
jgi:hypothetical protein